MKGKLISFEGLDGAGKTTQIDLLQVWLSRQGIPFVRTCEPGGTDLGVEIRKLLLDRPDLDIMPLAEAFLFQADRAQHFVAKIAPALGAGDLVVTDRYFDSSIVYQGIVRDMGVELIERLSLLATRGVAPSLTLLLDVSPEIAHARSARTTRFDAESEEFHDKVRHGFLALAKEHPRIKVIDASQDMQVVHEQVVSLVVPLLSGN